MQEIEIPNIHITLRTGGVIWQSEVLDGEERRTSNALKFEYSSQCFIVAAYRPEHCWEIVRVVYVMKEADVQLYSPCFSKGVLCYSRVRPHCVCYTWRICTTTRSTCPAPKLTAQSRSAAGGEMVSQVCTFLLFPSQSQILVISLTI